MLKRHKAKHPPLRVLIYFEPPYECPQDLIERFKANVRADLDGVAPLCGVPSSMSVEFIHHKRSRVDAFFTYCPEHESHALNDFSNQAEEILAINWGDLHDDAQAAA